MLDVWLPCLDKLSITSASMQRGLLYVLLQLWRLDTARHDTNQKATFRVHAQAAAV